MSTYCFMKGFMTSKILHFFLHHKYVLRMHQDVEEYYLVFLYFMIKLEIKGIIKTILKRKSTQ